MEESKQATIVKSLPVPSVQDLASKLDASGSIPDRYIRPEIEANNAVDVNTAELPVIDLGRLLDPQFSQDETIKLDYACEHWGFFQLINHGVPHIVIEKMKNDIQEFFKLPLEQKKAIAMLPNGIEGFGQHFVMSEHQKLDWADMLYLMPRPLHVRDYRFWPTEPPNFRDAVSEYSLEIKRVIISLTEAMAKGLRLEPEALLKHFVDVPQTMRFNHYPPCPKANDVIGLSPHSDGTGFTILLQVNDVQGLQIRKDGKWVSLQPIPGAFIINIGDTIEILTNGKYKSIEHRATVNTNNERFSIAAFHPASHDALIGPIQELVGDGKVNYKTMLSLDFTKAYFAAKLDGKNFMETVKIQY